VINWPTGVADVSARNGRLPDKALPPTVHCRLLPEPAIWLTQDDHVGSLKNTQIYTKIAGTRRVAALQQSVLAAKNRENQDTINQ